MQQSIWSGVFRCLVISVAGLGALGGVVEADFNKGVEALKANDYAEAAKEFRLSAEQGDELSQLNLGTLYAMGRGVPRDYQEAIRWFQAAAEQGMREAQYSLANLYDRGEGVPRDYTLAAKWYELSAEQGFESSQRNLGILYANGEGVPRDRIQAYFWLALAFANGDARAGRLRDRVAQGMSGREIEQAKALVQDWKPRRRNPRAR